MNATRPERENNKIKKKTAKTYNNSSSIYGSIFQSIYIYTKFWKAVVYVL